MPDQTLMISYIVFVLLQTLHTFEEIADDVFKLRLGPIVMNKRRYLIAASVLSTITISPLVLMVYGNVLGYYLGLFTSGVIGVFQGVVHTVGFLKSRTVRASLGAGFYSSIPLSIWGVVVFWKILTQL